MRPTSIIFDVGKVLYDWSPRFLYGRLIPEGEALDAFLRDVVTPEWHFQHDAGRPFSETSAELIAEHPEHRELIEAWGERFLDSIGPPIPGMATLIADLDAADVPLYAITNFSGEWWPEFRTREAALFDRLRGIVVSGDERVTKPDPTIYRVALERFGLKAAETVFIDDVAANVAAAESIGLIGIEFEDEPTLRARLRALGFPV